MKLLYTLLLSLAGLLISSHSVAQGSLAALDAKNGFRDAKIGMYISAFKGMVLVTNYPDKNPLVTRYTRPSDKLMLADIPLTMILYTFLDKRLYSIWVVAPRMEDSKKMLEAFTTAYGKWDITSTHDHYSWFGKKVTLGYIPGTSEEVINASKGRNSFIIHSPKNEEDFMDEPNEIQKKLRVKGL